MQRKLQKSLSMSVLDEKHFESSNDIVANEEITSHRLYLTMLSIYVDAFKYEYLVHRLRRTHQ
jgi:hypothetical protein